MGCATSRSSQAKQPSYKGKGGATFQPFELETRGVPDGTEHLGGSGTSKTSHDNSSRTYHPSCQVTQSSFVSDSNVSHEDTEDNEIPA